MSKEKTYTPQEAASKLLSRVQELYNLRKSNTAHEIEAGQEEADLGAECPESLEAGEAFAQISSSEKKGKKKKSEESEDTPEHEEGMTEEENQEHDAMENDADEKDEDIIEADEEEADEDEDKKENPFKKSEKLHKFLVNRKLKKQS